jgi:Leucine-rich repeat (LRR) protein
MNKTRALLGLCVLIGVLYGVRYSILSMEEEDYPTSTSTSISTSTSSEGLVDLLVEGESYSLPSEAVSLSKVLTSMLNASPPEDSDDEDEAVKIDVPPNFLFSNKETIKLFVDSLNKLVELKKKFPEKNRFYIENHLVAIFNPVGLTKKNSIPLYQAADYYDVKLLQEAIARWYIKNNVPFNEKLIAPLGNGAFNLAQEYYRQYWLIHKKLPDESTKGTLERAYESFGVSIQELLENGFVLSVAYGKLNLRNLHINSLEGLKNIAGLPALKYLDLNNNQLRSLPTGIFTGLTALEELRLNNNKLRSLPTGIFAGLTALKWLYLSHNQLRSLPTGIFTGLTALKWLHLDNNQLRSLPTGIFTGLTALEGLDLSHNQLRSLPTGIFTGLAALKWLHLDNNQLDSLPTGIFTGLAALKWLYLSHNQLRSLPTGIFAGLTALEKLNLNNNQLDSLPTGIFTDLTALTWLGLSHNQLRSLPTGIFTGLTALEGLRLGNNQLRSLPAGIFTGLTSLISLDLSHNKLDSLPTGIFAGLTALKWLYLNNNKLSSLPEDYFDGLTATINLQNQLSSPPAGIVGNLHALVNYLLRKMGYSG